MAEQNKLETLLNQEVALLDNILECQARVYASVKEKSWITLERNMASLSSLSAEFADMELAREKLIDEAGGVPEESMSLLAMLRSRLIKSKIQNQALSTYIETTQNFVRGVLESAVPQRRNVLYSRNGKIVKQEPESVVLNRVL